MIKRHRIFVHKVYVETPLSIKTISTNAGRRTEIVANSSYDLNQEVELCTIAKGKSFQDFHDGEVSQFLN